MLYSSERSVVPAVCDPANQSCRQDSKMVVPVSFGCSVGDSIALN
jgi:hypothetical protein